MLLGSMEKLRLELDPLRIHAGPLRARQHGRGGKREPGQCNPEEKTMHKHGTGSTQQCTQQHQLDLV